MIFNTKNDIPEVYGRERDVQVFTNLLDILLTFCKYRIDNLGDVYEANRCDESLLPLLGQTLNYQYNFKDTVTANRKIIDYFTLMERYRGSEVGLKMATALSLTSLNIATDNNETITVESDYLTILNDLEITYDYEKATIIIKYPNVYTLVRYLLDYVRPVGMYLDIRSTVKETIDDDAMLIYASTESIAREYNPMIDSRVNSSKVNFSITADPDWLLSLFETDTINLNE